MNTPLRGFVASVALANVLASCVGQIGNPLQSQSNDSGTTDATSAFGPSVGRENPTVVPFAHLTAAEYESTVADLFPQVALPVLSLPADVIVDGFDNNAAVQTATADVVDAYDGAAAAIATAAMASATHVLGCAPTTRAGEDNCAATFLVKLAPLAYRRPLDSSELADLSTFYASRRAAGDDFVTAMTLATEALLQSPFFIYKVEIGAPIAGRTDAVQLTPYEVATRLSYVLWGSMPDPDLTAAAANGDLATVTGIEAQARRLLADPRAHDAIVRFHGEWLSFGTMETLSKDPTAFPQFNSNVAAAMRSSAERYVENIFFSGGSLIDLLTDAHAWVNNALAPIYGVPAPGSATLTEVALDPGQRAGILTNAGLMAGLAHNLSDSPVLRGVFVLRQMMCMPTPPPPPGSAAANPPQGGSSGATLTTRALFATQHEQGSCALCHHTIDGLGFGFEHYDAVGAYRTSENGATVDSSGWFPDGAGDLSGTFPDAIALSSALANSRSVQACVVSQWMRYALGVDSSGVDIRQVVPILDDFVAAGLRLDDLVVSLVTSDAFRTRRIGS